MVFAFLIAGAAAALSAVCYSEFAVELPIAGGGFAYCLFVLGEFIAWWVTCVLLLARCKLRAVRLHYKQKGLDDCGWPIMTPNWIVVAG